MRSAKMNAITPPKLMPPFHSAAAIGTFPIEQTKLMIAMNGPTITFSIDVNQPCPCRNTSFQTLRRYEHRQQSGDRVPDDELAAQHLEVGDRVAGGVGPRGPRPQLRATTAHARARPGARRSRRPSPSGRGRRPSRPTAVASRARLAISLVTTSEPVSASSTIMIGPPMNSAAANCQPMSTTSTMPSSSTRFVDANMKIIAVVKSAPFWNRDFDIAVAAYEHDDDTMPSPLARRDRRARGDHPSPAATSRATRTPGPRPRA